jgi:hypothetical protein
VEGRFWSVGTDLPCSLRKELELELSARFGVGARSTAIEMGGLGRERPSWGGDVDGDIVGDVGKGVAAAISSVKRFKESVKSQSDGVVPAVFGSLSMNRGGGSP